MKAGKSFSGTPGRHSKKLRGADGTHASRQRIASLRIAEPGRFSITPATAACDRSLGKSTALGVLVLLGKYRNADTGICYPAVGTMADLLGITTRTVQRHINKLIARGYLVVEGRVREGGGWTSNIYTILYPEFLGPKKPSHDHSDEKSGEHVTPVELPPSEADLAGVSDATSGVASLTATTVPIRHPVSHGPSPDVASPCDTPRRINNSSTNVLLMNDPPPGGLPTDIQKARRGGPLAEGAEREKQVVRQRAIPRKLANMQREMPRDSIGEILDWVAKRIGVPAATLWALPMQWHSNLEAAGYGDVEAQAAIVKVGRRVQFGRPVLDPIRAIEDEVQALIEARLRGAAAA